MEAMTVERTSDTESTVMVPAGDYWLGDPCYNVSDHAVWMRWLEAAEYERNDKQDLVAEVPGTEFWIMAFGTQYGDGEYPASNGNSYGVDAGLIGLVPRSFDHELEEDKGTRTRIVFTEPTLCTRDSDGRMIFGSVVIETGDAADAEEEEDLYEDDVYSSDEDDD